MSNIIGPATGPAYLTSPQNFYNGTVTTPQWFGQLATNVNTLMAGTASVLALTADGTGGATATPLSGGVVTTAGLKASAGGVSASGSVLLVNSGVTPSDPNASGMGFNHIISTASSNYPTVTAGTGAGTSPGTLSTSGTDTVGLLTIQTGTSPAASATIATITFHSNVSNTVSNGGPCIFLWPTNSTTAALSGTSSVYLGTQASSGGNWTGWSIKSGSVALSGSNTYQWFYLCIFA